MTQSPRSDTHLVNKDDILALLEDGPKESGILARYLTLPQARLIAACQELQHAGVITRLPFPDRRWALPSQAPIFEAAVPPRMPERPPARVRAPLRQPDPRPSAAPVSKDAPPSWWVTASRDGFTARAGQERARMNTSRIGSKVPAVIHE